MTFVVGGNGLTGPTPVSNGGITGTVTPASWAQSLLTSLGMPTTTQNLKIIVAWEAGEGGHWNNSAKYNPLNTTQSEPGSSTFQSVGVGSAAIRIYTSWAQGLQATVATLQNGNYGAILDMLKSGNANSNTAASTINSSVWGTHDLSASMIDVANITGGTPVTPAPGGTAGAGGTGTSTSDTQFGSGFYVGDSSNPDEDYWTAMNRIGQERYWYVFSDGEIAYLADGPDLMAQSPAALTLDRIKDRQKIQSLELTYDNTAFQYASTHKKRKRIQRKTQLAKVQSPVEATLRAICHIDEVRAGDVVALSGCGPGDNRWLVGNVRRSVFEVTSEITLVPALSPLTEQQIAGVNPSNTALSSASQPGAGTVIAAMISAATTIDNQKLPYVWGGGHARVGVPSGAIQEGYDCSGVVAAVLKAGGIWKASSVGSDADLIATLQGQGLLTAGQGSGNPECTLFDNRGVHIFMRLNGVYFGTSDGLGGPNNTAPPSKVAGTGGHGGGGGSWLTSGPDVGTFTPYHFSQALLAAPIPASGG